jgi:16S rRNA A1518/A1519 N6-dimethyltransferase RsmA/KsgA/DIM1 with predicted DNA glycosylase/AP lyase activity
MVQIQRDLVFDIGLHKGEDTDYYLKKGFRVVAVEANSELVRECRSRFAQEIANERLYIIEGAVAEGRGKVLFYKNHCRLGVQQMRDGQNAMRNSAGKIGN